MDVSEGQAPTMELEFVRAEIVQPTPESTALVAARRSRPEHTSQAAAAAMLGLRVRDYTGLEGGRLTLSAEDWQRVMEVIRG